MPRVILTLKYDMGEYPELECLDASPEAFKESFLQGDTDIHEMEIVGVEIIK